VASDDYLRCVEASTAYYAEKSVEFASLESQTDIKILAVACGTGVVAAAIVKTLSPTSSTNTARKRITSSEDLSIRVCFCEFEGLHAEVLHVLFLVFMRFLLTMSILD
jgi:hypothetical protein